jgi:hypothetical protein
MYSHAAGVILFPSARRIENDWLFREDLSSSLFTLYILSNSKLKFISSSRSFYVIINDKHSAIIPN